MARSKPDSGSAPRLDKKGNPKVGRLKKLGNNVRLIKQAWEASPRAATAYWYSRPAR